MTTFTTIDPATARPLETFERLTRDGLDKAIHAATVAFTAWRDKPVDDRGIVLASVAQALRSEARTLATIAVREMGKPMAQALAEIEKCARCCEYFAIHGEAMLANARLNSEAKSSYAAFRPLGLVLAVMPWNFPYWQVIRAAAPAMMAGNVVLLKHAENTTRCGLELERIFHEAGAMEGAFTTLLASHDDTGTLIADPRVAAVTLTGSERAGSNVAAAAGSAIKKCVLELGGSDAFIVFADADLQRAADVAVTARFQNNGQSCIAAKRFIVERSVHDEFLTRFVDAAKAQRVGNPMDESVGLGPIARADLRDTLHEQVQATIDAGASLALGGRPIDGDGFYYEATIVDGVTPSMRMFTEEVFGPAAAVTPADDAASALDLANASSYGLGASIWTRDVERAQVLATRIEAGMIYVNAMVSSDPRLPFGGIKKSGYGRELSSFGIHEFVNIQTVWVHE